MRVPYCPAAPITLGAAAVAGWLSNSTALPHEISLGWSVPQLVIPRWPEVLHSFEIAVLPQLSLTLTNAVVVTASLAREFFPNAAPISSERNLALSSGLANVLLSPFGAMPMCHVAGGPQAQYRFGARTGLAPIPLWLRTARASGRVRRRCRVPVRNNSDRRRRSVADHGGTDLAVSRRLFDARPSCWPVIGATALVTLIINPGLGLVMGWVSEFVRAATSVGWPPRHHQTESVPPRETLPKKVTDRSSDGAQADRRACDHRVEPQTECRIEGAGSDHYRERVEHEGEEQVSPAKLPILLLSDCALCLDR